MSSCVRLGVEGQGAGGGWQSVKSMNMKRHSAAAASISSTQVRGVGRERARATVTASQFVLCGGRGGSEADLDSVEAYCPTQQFHGCLCSKYGAKVLQVRCSDRFLADLSSPALSPLGRCRRFFQGLRVRRRCEPSSSGLAAVFQTSFCSQSNKR